VIHFRDTLVADLKRFLMESVSIVDPSNVKSGLSKIDQTRPEEKAVVNCSV